MALISQKAWDYSRPILAANGGWCLMQGTPRGKNHFYDLYQTALKHSDEWKVVLQKTSEIKHIPEKMLVREREQMSAGMYAQEYEVDFSLGIDGAFYGREIDNLHLNGQICPVPWDSSQLVWTAWDLGLSVGNETAVIFYQINDAGTQIKIIDYLEKNNTGLDEVIKMVKEKPYTFAGHFAPHDIKVRELSDAVSRHEKARQLGIEFQILPQQLKADGIENCLTHFRKMWIDETKCARLISALENYHREWDEMRQVYGKDAVHDWSSNGADAFRYLCQSLTYAKKSLSGVDYDRIRNTSLYGNRDPFYSYVNPGQRFF